MRNVSIYGQKWLDLVFEGKNKAYGAYQLRQESAETSAKAFVCGIALIGGLFVLLSSFSEKKETEENNTPIIVTHINTNPIIPTEQPKQPQAKAPKKPKTDTPPITKAPPVVTATVLADVDVPTNTQAATAPSTTTGSTTGTLPSTGTSPSGTNTIVTPTVITGPLKPSELDRQPNFPGGMQNFYQYVANNFDRENIDETETIRVNVSFVIETDGTMTNIQVKENTNKIIAKEAIRVLKSLNKKWTPGIKDGQTVRTQFTLPITVLL